MSMPTTPSGAGTGNVMISIDVVLLDELREIAKRNRRSISAQVAVYVDTGLERDRVVLGHGSRGGADTVDRPLRSSPEVRA